MTTEAHELDHRSEASWLVARDPRDGRELGRLRPTDLNLLSEICLAASEIFKAEWRRPSIDHASLLRGLAEAIEDNRARLVQRADEETALGYARLDGELSRTVFQLRMCSTLVTGSELLDPVIDTADTRRVPPRADQRRMNVPLGPVAVFAASNFPFAFGVLGGDTASALAAGCPVIVKAHPAQPLTSRMTTDIVEQVLLSLNVPRSWLQVIDGEGVETGVALVQDGSIEAVTFTGSFVGGKALIEAASRRSHPIPVYAEMGSLNPAFVGMNATNVRSLEIATGWASTLSTGAGQFCTKPGILVVPDGEGARVMADAIVERVGKADMIPMLSEGILTNYRRALEVAASLPGVRSAWTSPTSDRPGLWPAPAVLQTTASDVMRSPRLLEEVFGPAGLLVICEEGEQAVELAAQMPGSLAASVFFDPPDRGWAQELVVELSRRCGRVVVNGWPTGVSVGHATMHGGPWPVTNFPQFTSVGSAAVRRFQRAVAFQGAPDEILHPALRDSNPLGLRRLLDGDFTERPVLRPGPPSTL